jgi:hypothetical protein
MGQMCLVLSNCFYLYFYGVWPTSHSVVPFVIISGSGQVFQALRELTQKKA